MYYTLSEVLVPFICFSAAIVFTGSLIGEDGFKQNRFILTLAVATTLVALGLVLHYVPTTYDLIGYTIASSLSLACSIVATVRLSHFVTQHDHLLRQSAHASHVAEQLGHPHEKRKVEIAPSLRNLSTSDGGHTATPTVQRPVDKRTKQPA